MPRKLVKIRHQLEIVWVDGEIRVIHKYDAATTVFREIADKIFHPLGVPAFQPPVHNQRKVTFRVATTICQAFIKRWVELRSPCTEDHLSTFSSEYHIFRLPWKHHECDIIFFNLPRLHRI